MPLSSFASYFKKVVLVTFVSISVCLIFFQFYPQYYFTIFPYLVLFFFTSTLVIHFLLSSAAKQKPQVFVRHFMMITGGKLFLYFFTMGVVAYKLPKSDLIAFVLSFFLFYLIFSIIEVQSVLGLLKASSSANKVSG